MEIEFSPPRLHAGAEAFECATRTLKNSIIANSEDKVGFIENKNWASRVMQFISHTGLKVSPFELYHGWKPRTEPTNLVKSIRSFLSEWSTKNV